MESIDFDAFAGCTALTDLTIPKSVTRIGEGAFAGCGSLAKVRFEGSEEQWKTVRIADGNEPLLAAEMSFGA